MNKIIFKAVFLYAVLTCLLSMVTPAQAITCPELPNKVNVTVAAQVSFNSVSQIYTYSYTLSSAPGSVQEVDGFHLDFAPPMLNVTRPFGWTTGHSFSGSNFGWDATEVANPDEMNTGTAIPPSIVQIKPGMSLSGFSFQSPNPPGIVTYYVTGFAVNPPLVGATAAEAEDMAETLAEQCPSGHRRDVAVTGTTQGPVGGAGVLEFSALQYRTSEGATSGALSFTITRNIGSKGAVTVDLRSSDGAAIAGRDYTQGEGRLSFADGDAAPITLELPITSETLVENDENLFLTLSNPLGGAVLGRNKVNAWIDNDDAGLQFSAPGFSVNEGTPTATISVSRIGFVNKAVAVNYATSNGPAVAGSDYASASGTLSFASGEIVKTFTVPIINDSAAESTEFLNLTLSSPVNAVLGEENPTAFLFIRDNEAGQLRFSSSGYFGSESTPSALVTVLRLGNASAAAAVNYATSNGSAVAGADYTAASGTLNFAANQNQLTFNVPVNNDAVNEFNETVMLTLSNTSGAVLVAPSTATLVIRDNEAPLIRFSAAGFSVNETMPTATITVFRQGSLAAAASVQYATANGTATAGTDYTARSGALNFGINQNLLTFTIPVLNDAAVETNETVNVGLSNPIGAALGTPAAASLTIISNE